MDDERRQAHEDGYVECTECGHPVEQHSTAGCNSDMCDCTVAWAPKEIRSLRIRLGLPGHWEG